MRGNRSNYNFSCTQYWTYGDENDLEKKNSNCLSNEWMKCELQKLKNQVVEKHIRHIEVLKQKKQKLQILQEKLKELNEEKEHDKQGRSRNTEDFLKVISSFEETVLYLEKSSQEKKDACEEMKLQKCKEIEQTRIFMKRTQRMYQTWQEKSETLKEKMNTHKKYYKELSVLYSEVFRFRQDIEEKYFNLKSNAEAELLRANEEYWHLCKIHQQDIKKLEFNIKGKRIRISTLEHSLQCKKHEIETLSLLCEEFGNGMKKSLPTCVLGNTRNVI